MSESDATQARLYAHVESILNGAAFRRRDRDDLAEELYGHLWQRWQDALASGLGEEAAADQAIRSFGGPASLSRDVTLAYHSRLYASTIGDPGADRRRREGEAAGLLADLLPSVHDVLGNGLRAGGGADELDAAPGRDRVRRDPDRIHRGVPGLPGLPRAPAVDAEVRRARAWATYLVDRHTGRDHSPLASGRRRRGRRAWDHRPGLRLAMAPEASVELEGPAPSITVELDVRAPGPSPAAGRTERHPDRRIGPTGRRPQHRRSDPDRPGGPPDGADCRPAPGPPPAT